MRFAVALLFALSACSQDAKPENQTEVAAQESVPKAGIDRAKAGSEAPTATFIDVTGKEVRIADFKGRPVLLNLWASWCVPCIKELPTLAKLNASNAVQVLAVSQDSGPQASVKAFLAKLGVAGLGAYQDAAMRLPGALDAQILPTSVLYDAQGREVWRYTGDLDWTGPEAAKLLAEAGARGDSATS
jgi:thiol-disulfide isomerase/thioredoxin